MPLEVPQAVGQNFTLGHPRNAPSSVNITCVHFNSYFVSPVSPYLAVTYDKTRWGSAEAVVAQSSGESRILSNEALPRKGLRHTRVCHVVFLSCHWRLLEALDRWQTQPSGAPPPLEVARRCTGTWRRPSAHVGVQR